MRKFKSFASGVLAFACIAGALHSGAAQAQAYPAKTIKLVVPYAPGGLPDVVARTLATRLQENLGQSVIVENKPGGNGAVAASSLLGSPADGYTFLVTDGSMMTINPLTKKKLSYDANKDFEPVSLVASSPLFLAVNSSVKAQNLEEFLALVKANPGRINYGSSGTGSSHHLTTEAMKSALNIFMTHIPYRGSGASVPALVGQQVEMVFAAYPSLAPFAKNGQVRILATNSLKRSDLAPEVPAISEKIPGFDFAVLVGMFAPAGTPKEAIQRISAEVQQVAARRDVVDQMKVAGIEMIGGGPAKLNEAIVAERNRMAKVVKYAKIEE